MGSPQNDLKVKRLSKKYPLKIGLRLF